MPLSKIKTNSLANGAVGTSQLATGAITSAVMPTGSVVQVVQTTSTSSWNQTSGVQSTWQDITGKSRTITPTRSSNKILITWSACGILNNVGGIGIQLLRGSTSVHVMESLINQAPWSQGCYTFSFLDSPSTTSATTYKIQGMSQVATATAEFRVNYNHPNISGTPQSTLIAQEIVG